MSRKTYRSGRAMYDGSVTVDGILSAVLRDLSRHCDLSRIIVALATDPESVRGVISQELLLAEQQLEEGGFVRYAVLRQVEAIVKKNPDFYASSPEQRSTAAWNKFLAAERRCARANRRLAHFQTHWLRAPFAEQVLEDAAVLIGDTLGSFTANHWEKVFDNCTYTNGASFKESATMDLSIFGKMTRGGTVTRKAEGVLRAYLKTNPYCLLKLLAEQGLSYEIVRGDRVSFVSKTAGIDRVILVQPSWNVFLQKGVDKLMRDKLLRVGVDLSDQTLNHVPALIGSIDGSNATIDLVSASDTVCSYGVKRLLKYAYGWYEALDKLRCREYTNDKGESWHSYEKFSGMGNCFTFPLETLIFWAISKSCMSYCQSASRMLCVYGDDIVIPTEAYCLTTEVLRYAGFEPNLTKSFATGHFRETCGCDFIYGVNVRPVYVKKRPRSVQDIYNLYNRFLCNPLGLTFPSLLHYLLGSLHDYHKGPAFQLAGDDWITWYSGKSRENDNYIISECPEPKWNSEWQTRFYSYSSLQRRRITGKSRWEVRYRALLAGHGPEHYVSNKSKIVQVRRETTYWPTLSEGLTLLRSPHRHAILAWVM